MSGGRRTLFFGVAAGMVIALFAGGCGRASGKDNVLATVNGEPIYVKDLNRSLAVSVRRDPTFRLTPGVFEDQLDMMIDKKLLIQEAVKGKLDRTEKFRDTINTFWEQTLIRDLMTHKYKGIDRAVLVSDAEITAYYDKLSRQKTFSIAKSKDKNAIANIVKEGPAGVKWDETVGPVTYDDTASGLVRRAFDIPEGRMRVFMEGDTYYLFYTARDVKIPVQPFEEMKDGIRRKIIGMKKQDLFKSWLEGVRGKAKVDINENAMKGMRYGS